MGAPGARNRGARQAQLAGVGISPGVLVVLAAALLLTLPAVAAEGASQPSGATQSKLPKISSIATASSTPNPAVAGAAPSARDRSRAESFYLRGLRAMQQGNTKDAEKNFARAAKLDPTNRQYVADREIAREHRVTELVQQAAKERVLGRADQARQKLAQALLLDPNNPEITQHLGGLGLLSAGGTPGSGITARIAPPIQLRPTQGRQSFHMRATVGQVVRKVLSAYGIDPTIDDSVARKQIVFNAEKVDYAHAAFLLRMATNTFFVPLDPKRVLVARDTRENRERFERLAVETLRLPGLTDTELSSMGNIARNELEIKQVTTDKSSGTLTVRAPQYRLAALNGILEDLVRSKGEVLLEVRMYDVSSKRMRNVGVQLPPTLTLFNVPSQLRQIIQQNQSLVDQIISSGLADAGDDAAIVAILVASGALSNTVFNQPFALFGGGATQTGVGVPPVTANFTLNSSEARVLDQVDLRLANKEEGTIRSGVRYPIVTSSYTNIANPEAAIPGLNTAGLSSSLAGLGLNLNSLAASQAIPQVQYQDLGLSLKATPTIQRTGNIALKLEFKLTALTGNSLNGLPVLSNTDYTADVVVGAGASAMLVSNLSRQQTRAVAGIPGLSDLPGFQSTTNDNSQVSDSDLVIVITPHLVRRRHFESSGPLIPLPPHS